jgi:hypothetical protein
VKALAEDNLGSTQEAIESYRRFVELAPDSRSQDAALAKERIRILGVLSSPVESRAG